jgi:hypothetical protein
MGFRMLNGRIFALLVACLVVGGCGSVTRPGATPTSAMNQPTEAPAATAAGCPVEPKTYDDLAGCDGESQQISLDVADGFQGKTIARIAIASRSPADIVAAMGAYTREWSTGANSFTLFAYGDVGDYAAGARYNRGRVFWNDGGTITVNVCTEISQLEDGMDICDDEAEYTVANR